MFTSLFIAVVVGYFLGALPFGYLVARAHGVNIFEVGSKNPGATNVRRVLGARAGNLVFTFDALKGFIATGWPLWLASTLSFESEVAWVQIGGVTVVERGSALTSAISGLVGALLGHSFSCFTRFRGGKGVATGSGGVLVLMPLVAGIAAAIWTITFYASRYVSLASIVAAGSLPVLAYFFGVPHTLMVFASLIAIFVIVRHRANVVRLLNGTENKFVKKKKSDSDTPVTSSKHG